MGPKKKASKDGRKALESVADSVGGGGGMEIGGEEDEEGALNPDSGTGGVAEGYGSTVDTEQLGRDRDEVKKLRDRRNALERTISIMSKHDVVVQKLINKARDDLVWEQVQLNPDFLKSRISQLLMCLVL